MNPPPLVQIAGNVCAALAVLVILLPLRRLLQDYARTHLSDDRWVKPVLRVLIPLWLLLMGALLCMTAGGGFDGLRLGRPALHLLTVAEGVALTVLNFVFIGLYIRPGFTPRAIYTPFIHLLPLATGLLALLSLNRKLAPGIPIQWLQWPWTLVAALSLIGCLGFLGHRLVTTWFGEMAGFVLRILDALTNTPKYLAKIAALDPQRDFTDLLPYASQHLNRALCEAATARLRSRPDFIDALLAVLESRSSECALSFLAAATLSSEEQKRLALPAHTALERFIEDIPAPNYMPSNRRKQMLRWGRKTFPRIARTFSGTDVDFSQIIPKLEHALRPDDTPR